MQVCKFPLFFLCHKTPQKEWGQKKKIALKINQLCIKNVALEKNTKVEKFFHQIKKHPCVKKMSHKIKKASCVKMWKFHIINTQV